MNALVIFLSLLLLVMSVPIFLVFGIGGRRPPLSGA